jgi:uncharacterized metal-binding protein
VPSGKTHVAVETILLPAFIAGYEWLLKPPTVELGIFAGTYLFSSFFLSPDLDLRHNSARRRWGPLGFIWTPYTIVFKHRGMSHSVILGTMTRLIYLAALSGFVSLALVYAGMNLPQVTFQPRLLLIAYAGLAIPNILHATLDRIVSACK